MDHIKYPADKVIAFMIALDHSDIDSMRRFFKEEPDLFRKLRQGYEEFQFPTWIVCEAAKESSPDGVRALLELGADINEQDSNGNTGLCCAVQRGRYEVAKTLLDCGADPNLDCPLFNVASQDLEERIPLAELLLDHGSDINQLFLVEGLPPRNVLSEAIDQGHTELVEFLKSRGAKLPEGWLADEEEQAQIPLVTPGDYTADILAYFRSQYGKPEKRVIREIVPTSDYPVTVHYIPPSANKTDDLGILFTVGLSRFEMPVPKGEERYRRAELMIILDKSWPPPQKAIKKRKWAWPIQWLRKIAAFPVENNTWLGAELTTLTEEDPPQPLASGVPFTSWLLVSLESEESVVKCKDGTTIQIYQLFPIYTEEYRYARKDGAGALMSLFVERDIGEQIDLNRPNVAPE